MAVNIAVGSSTVLSATTSTSGIFTAVDWFVISSVSGLRIAAINDGSGWNVAPVSGGCPAASGTIRITVPSNFGMFSRFVAQYKSGVPGSSACVWTSEEFTTVAASTAATNPGPAYCGY